MAHSHSVYDSDTRFSINAVTRQIKNESSRKTTLMQNDHNSERFTFELPRMIEGHDMSLCNQVEVHYLNSSSKDKNEFRKGLYTVDDLQVSPDDPEKVICSWLISQNATQLVGKLSFRLRFKCVEDGVITYAWHTAVFADISVSDGINADETFEMDYVDIIEQWKEAIQAEFAQWHEETVSEMSAEITAWKEVESGKVRGEMTAFSSQWNQALDVERKRIDQFVAMPEGATTNDAELQDIRVGADGVTYNSAGTAVREQIGALSDILGGISDGYLTSENLLDSNTFTVDTFIQSDGSITTSGTYSLSDYIPVRKGWTLCGYIAPNTITALGSWFDKDKVRGGKIEELTGYEYTDQEKRYFTLNVDFDGYIRMNVYTNAPYTSAMLKLNAQIDTTLTFPLLNNYVPYEKPHYFSEKLNGKTGLEDAVSAIRMANGVFNPNNAESGYLAAEGAQVWSNEMYATSDYIPIEANADYVIQGITTRFCLYSEDKSAVSSTFDSTKTANREFNAASAAYVRFTYYVSESERMYFRQANENVYDTLLGTAYIHSGNALLGKTLVTIGDSIMAGNGNNNFGIGYIIASRNSMKLTDYSEGGATIGYISEQSNNKLNIQYQKDLAVDAGVTPDYILIDGQTNDIDKTAFIGIGEVGSSYDVDSFDKTTFAGGLETIFYDLKTAYPTAKIIYVRAHHIGNRALSSQEKYGDVAAEACAKWGVSVADVFNNGTMNTFMEVYKQFTNNNDGTHPTREGYDRFYINLIENVMRST